MLTMFMAAMLIAAQASQSDDFCSELREVVHAAVETPSFRSAAAESLSVRLGFRDACDLLDDDQGRRLVCYQYAAPATLTEDRLAADTMRCLPGAIRQADSSYPAGTRIRLGAVTLRIHETGTPDGHIGRQVYFVVTRD